MLRCADCGDDIDDLDDDEGIVVEQHPDLDLAVHALTKGIGDEARRLSDVMHHLTRAIPALHPIIALIERETGRKLTP